MTEPLEIFVKAGDMEEVQAEIRKWEKVLGICRDGLRRIEEMTRGASDISEKVNGVAAGVLQAAEEAMAQQDGGAG